MIGGGLVTRIEGKKAGNLDGGPGQFSPFLAYLVAAFVGGWDQFKALNGSLLVSDFKKSSKTFYWPPCVIINA